MLRTYRTPLLVLLLVILVFGLVISGVFYTKKLREATERNVAAQHLQSSAAAESFTDPAGNPVALNNYAGQAVIVTSWASWCPQCVEELTFLNKHVADKAIPVLAINRKESKEVAGRYMLELPALANVTFILDSNDYYFNSLEGYAMPETIIYNKAGEVVFHGRGITRHEDIAAVLEALTPV